MIKNYLTNPFLHSFRFYSSSSRIPQKPVKPHTGCKSCFKLPNAENKQAIKPPKSMHYQVYSVDLNRSAVWF